MQLSGKSVLVTGGARGIGAQITRQLVAKGAKVIIVGRNRSGLDGLVSDLGEAVTAIAADLSDAEAVDDLIARLRTDHADLSVLINNAAIQTEMDFHSSCEHDWTAEAREEIAVNLQAVVALAIGLLAQLKRQPQAAIVNVGSALAIAPKQASPVYCATKAGMRSFTKALRYQCRQKAPNVLVCEVIMALVDTDMTRGRGSGKITPCHAAASLIGGLEAGRTEIWVSRAKLLKIVNRLLPALAERILR
ncbi:SDR family oxidoreductase [Hoeflea sp. TYP-13]|uniref:SDR family oxidoreductase n=1 Tax=Hoeflea sp. TYP-13 TaxID=3230023 RepID=UPI0034C6BBDF